MTVKIKDCTLGAKHKWEFVKNVTFISQSCGPSGTKAHIRFRGKYKCACGEVKYGREK